MTNKLFLFFCLICFIGVQAGCMTGAEHQKALPATQEREMTIGVVQKEIRVGMSGTQVAEALGSPNIVTKDSEGDETWVYDKIATEAYYSTSSGGIGAGVGAGGLVGTTLILGGVGGGFSRSSGAASTTQKTLTVVIKFDKNSQVKSFSYHASKF